MLAYNDPEIGTRHKNQGHTKETHRKSSEENEANYGLKGESASHPTEELLVKFKLKSPMNHLFWIKNTKYNLAEHKFTNQ